MKSLFFLFQASFILLSYHLQSQSFTDNFSSLESYWSGNTTSYVTTNNQLQSNVSASGIYYVSTPIDFVSETPMQWKFSINLNFAPSTSNFSQVWLQSEDSDLPNTRNGIYLKFGESGSEDAIRLVQRSNNIDEIVASGISGSISAGVNADITANVNTNGIWSIQVNYNNAESETFQTTTPVYPSGINYGYVSTLTSSRGDDYLYGPIAIGVDRNAPVLNELRVIDERTIEFIFDEMIATSPFSINAQNNALIDSEVNENVILTRWNSPFVNFSITSFNLMNISDDYNNLLDTIVNYEILIFSNPDPKDVIINEVMADPTPSRGLPEIEYIEIWNRSNKLFNLQTWNISDGNRNYTIFNPLILRPDSYALLYDFEENIIIENVETYNTDLPAITNTSDYIALLDNDLQIIDEFEFNIEVSDIDNDGKSLEIINPSDPCSINNIGSSTALVGGTPGKINSIFNEETFDALAVQKTYFEENTFFIQLSQFISNSDIPITIDPQLNIRNVSTEKNILSIELENITPNIIYNFTFNDLENCNQTQLLDTTIQFSLPENLSEGDIFINEVMYEDDELTPEFVELWNVSNKTIQLNQLTFATLENNELDDWVIIEDQQLILPNSFVILSSNIELIKKNYQLPPSAILIDLNLPSLTNDGKTIALIKNDIILDSLSYHPDWHSPLLDETRGISLEKINPTNKNIAQNWTSAATIPKATPGKINSQYFESIHNFNNEMFSLEYSSFSPNGDGYRDVLPIHFNTQDKTVVASVLIYDIKGFLVHEIIKNELLEKSGEIYWNGAADENLLKTGVYILVIESIVDNKKTSFQKIPFSILTRI